MLIKQNNILYLAVCAASIQLSTTHKPQKIKCISSPDLAHADHPDEKSIMTYVAALYEIFPKEPTVQETLYDNVSTVYFVWDL